MSNHQSISFQDEQIWRIYPDEIKKNLALEVKNISDKKNYVFIYSLESSSEPLRIDISPSQTLLAYYDDCILLGEFDNNSSLSLPKGIWVYDKDFELVWEIEDAYYYDIVLDKSPQVVFSLEGKYYQLPLLPTQNEVSPRQVNEKKPSLIQGNVYTGLNYGTEHPHYEDLKNFISLIHSYNITGQIIHSETPTHLAFSTLNEADENILFLTDKGGEIILSEVVNQGASEALNFLLTQTHLFLLKSKNEVLIFDILI